MGLTVTSQTEETTRHCAAISTDRRSLSFLSATTMLLSVLSPLLALPFVNAGVHKLKLQKLPPADSNPSLESAYLAEKYGSQPQLPLMGAGGAGRQIRINRPSYNQEGEELLWTQDMINNGGHGVPLSSECQPISINSRRETLHSQIS